MTEYLAALVRYTHFETMPNGEYLATFPPNCPFHTLVYAQGDTVEACAFALEAVLESYLLWAVQTGQPLPEVDGLTPPMLEPSNVLAS